MVALIQAGRTIRQVADELKLNPNTVRSRARARGLKADESKKRSRSIRARDSRSQEASKPCSCGGMCKSVGYRGHRFGADTYCACGTSWFVHQRYPVDCPDSKRREPISMLESRDVCCNGHVLGIKNLYVSPKGKRQCRKCRSDNDRKRNEDGRVQERVLVTHCQRGHEFTEANTYRSPNDTKRQCRACKQMRADALSEKRRVGGWHSRVPAQHTIG